MGVADRLIELTTLDGWKYEMMDECSSLLLLERETRWLGSFYRLLLLHEPVSKKK
jgi:hypothetical protein